MARHSRAIKWKMALLKKLDQLPTESTELGTLGFGLLGKPLGSLVGYYTCSRDIARVCHSIYVMKSYGIVDQTMFFCLMILWNPGSIQCFFRKIQRIMDPIMLFAMESSGILDPV